MRNFLRWFAVATIGLIGVAQAAQPQTVVIQGLIRKNTGTPNTPPAQLNAPWSQCDIGSPPAAGSATNGSGAMTAIGAGDVGSNNNVNVLTGHLVYQAITGPFDISTVVSNIAGTQDWREAGLIATDGACDGTLWGAITASVEKGAAQQGVGFHLSNLVNGRATSYTTATTGPLPPPVPLRLTWDGTQLCGFYGDTATGPWHQADCEARAFTGANYIGAVVSSGSLTNTELSTATFTEPVIVVPTGTPGTISYQQATFTILENAVSFAPCLTRGGGSSGAISAHVHASGGSATSSDWTTGDLDQTVSWADGDVAVKCTGAIHVTNRAGTQGPRTITLSLTTFTGGATAGAQATETITITDFSAATSAKKWHPGVYPISDRNPTYRFGQSARFAQYDGEASTAFAGWTYWTTWSQLEGATHGNYTAGDTMLAAEIAHLKNEASPKRLIVGLDDEMYGGSSSWYPAYLVSAGCVLDEVWSDGVHHLQHFKWWVPTCASYFADLMTHLGATFDGEKYLEAVIIDYEQAYGQSVAASFSHADFVTGVTTAMNAAATAFPHTNLKWQANWGEHYHEANLVDILAVAKSLGIGWGSQDACSIDPTSLVNVYGTYPIYQDAQNLFAGYGGYDTGHHAGQYTDQRGKMLSIAGAENSELGYNSVCNGQGFAGYATVGNGLRAAGYMSLYDEFNAEYASHWHIDYNMETGANVQRWAVGVTGSLWDLAINHPPIHTQCPTDYDVKFGNGIAGSGTGCDPN